MSGYLADPTESALLTSAYQADEAPGLEEFPPHLLTTYLLSRRAEALGTLREFLRSCGLRPFSWASGGVSK